MQRRGSGRADQRGCRPRALTVAACEDVQNMMCEPNERLRGALVESCHGGYNSRGRRELWSLLADLTPKWLFIARGDRCCCCHLPAAVRWDAPAAGTASACVRSWVGTHAQACGQGPASAAAGRPTAGDARAVVLHSHSASCRAAALQAGNVAWIGGPLITPVAAGMALAGVHWIGHASRARCEPRPGRSAELPARAETCTTRLSP